MSRLGAMVLCSNMQQSVGAELSPGLLPRRGLVKGRNRKKMLVMPGGAVSLLDEQYNGEQTFTRAVLSSL